MQSQLDAWREVLVEGWSGLMMHRTRTVLSGLGILFGVAAILAILSIGEGAQREQEALIERLGVLNVQIRNVDFDDDPEREKEVRRVSMGLSLRDVAALKTNLPQARWVGAARELPVLDVVPRPRRLADVRLLGASPEWLAGSSLVLTQGRPLNPVDEDTRATVCVIGKVAARSLFGPEDPLLQRVRVGSTWFTVVGVFEEVAQAADALEGVSVESRAGSIVVPLSTALGRLVTDDGEPPLSEIQLTVTGLDHVMSHVGLAQRLLHRTHGEQEDVTFVVPLEMLEQARAQQRLFNLVLGLIAGISLLVGGIGIMNIMLASVLERTREIGIRLAIGATPADIARLFLVEASMISLIGGVFGVFAGLAMSGLVAAATGWSTSVSVQAILLVLVLATLEGLVFGYLPARRASKLPPVIAVQQP